MWDAAFSSNKRVKNSRPLCEDRGTSAAPAPPRRAGGGALSRYIEHLVQDSSPREAFCFDDYGPLLESARRMFVDQRALIGQRLGADGHGRRRGRQLRAW